MDTFLCWQLGPVFTLHVAGERLTFLTEAEDFHHFFQSSNVDFQRAVQDPVQNIGKSYYTISLYSKYDNALYSTCLIHIMEVKFVHVSLIFETVSVNTCIFVIHEEPSILLSLGMKLHLAISKEDIPVLIPVHVILVVMYKV